MVRVSIKKKTTIYIHQLKKSTLALQLKLTDILFWSQFLKVWDFFYHCQTIVWFSFPFLLYIFFLFVDFKNMMIASVWRIERSSSEATEMRNTMNHINIFFLSMFYDNIQVPISDRWNNLQSAQYIGLQGCAITKIIY